MRRFDHQVALVLPFGEESGLRSIIDALIQSNAYDGVAGDYEILSITDTRKSRANPLGAGGEIGVLFYTLEGAEKVLAILRGKRDGK